MRTESLSASRTARRGRALACLGIIVCLALLAPGPLALAREPGTGGVARSLSAQADLHIQILRVQVMPEFDNPRVLVVVQGRLAESDALPAKVTFRLPREASINQMAVMSMDGGTLTQEYEALPDGADPRWRAVTYTLTNAHFFYEYYYDPLAAGADKEFTYTLSSLYPIDDLLLEVQEPARATSFQVEPHPATNRVDSSLGLTYHQIQVGRVAAGEDVTVAVRYTKADPDPSLSWQQVMALEDAQAPTMPAMAAPAATTRQPQSGSLLGLLAGAGLALLVLGAAYAAWRAPRSSPAHGRSSVLVCSRCGTALRAGALFCHSCGTPGPTPRHPSADPTQQDGTAGCSPLEVRL